GAALGALGAPPAVAETARARAGQREPERQVAPTANDGVLAEPAKGSPDPDRRSQSVAHAAAEGAEEARGGVGEGIVAKKRERQGGNPHARAVHGGEASEEQVPAR